jgi:DNA-3-methyladenine glycosylase II
MHVTITLRPPFSLPVTVDALRRLSANVVDVAGPDGVYRRALQDERGVNAIEVRQPSSRALDVLVHGEHGERWLPDVERMLGVRAQLDEWYRRVEDFPWLARLAKRFRGVRPPQYPTLWEALAHAIVFQQISIHAAGAIMRRMVEALSPEVECGSAVLRPFPLPGRFLAATDLQLRAAGLSSNKVAHLRSIAAAVESGALARARIDELSSAGAAAELARVRGVGPWSAAVVLLRGFGRLDVFPMKDSGVAKSMALLCDDPRLDAEHLLDALGPVRGMLYYHLLLGRINHLVSPPSVTPPAKRSSRGR